MNYLGLASEKDVENNMDALKRMLAVIGVFVPFLTCLYIIQIDYESSGNTLHRIFLLGLGLLIGSFIYDICKRILDMPKKKFNRALGFIFESYVSLSVLVIVSLVGIYFFFIQVIPQWVSYPIFGLVSWCCWWFTSAVTKAIEVD